MRIVRAYQLTKGCVFARQMVEYVVTKVDDKFIHYYTAHKNRIGGGVKQKMGNKSQEKFRLVSGNPSLTHEEQEELNKLELNQIKQAS